MANEYSLINISQLDLDALSQYLIQANKLVYKQGDKETADTAAMDVDKVAGIDSDNIARAVVAYDNNIDDNLKEKEDYTDYPFLWADGVTDEVKNILKQRNTVRNSARLGGLPASAYMTFVTGKGITAEQAATKETYSEEIKDLRDELYQLRHELERNNTVNDYGFYNGFADNFDAIKPRYIKDAVGEISATGFSGKQELVIDNPDVLAAFDKGDYIVLATENNYYAIAQIKDKVSGAFVFEKGLNFVHAGEESAADGTSLADGKLIVYKSKGVVHGGLFKFTTEPQEQPGPVFYNGLGDDRKTTAYILDTEGEGLAYSFRIIGESSNDVSNESAIGQQGYLESFRILVKPDIVDNNPENYKLFCYIIDKRDYKHFLNPTYFEDLYNSENNPIRFFAKASAEYNGSNNKQYITFDFGNEGVYPLMSRDTDPENQDNNEKVEYMAIITAKGVHKASGSSRACRFHIVCLQKNASEGGDLEQNYILYDYAEKEPDSSALSIVETENDKDLFFQIVTRGVIENEPYPLANGLYTAHYHNQNMRSGLNGQVARVTLRIKREGKYITNIENTEPQVFLASDNISAKSDDSSVSVDLDDMHLDTKDFYVDLQARDYDVVGSENYVPAVIGNNITFITNCDPRSPESVTSGKPVLVDDGDKICRVGYIVAIKARVIDFNKKTGACNISPYDRYLMPLTYVCKDFDPASNEYSDRLIFEAVMDNKTEDENGEPVFKAYNDFELQIYFEHNRIARASGFDTDIAVRRKMTGALKDVVLSIDKAF